MFIMVFAFMFSVNISVYADTVQEEESNDSKETAQLIQANKETAVQVQDHPEDRAGQYVVQSYLSEIDEDWFKVYLSAGTQYVTLNGDPFMFEVYDPDGNLIFEDTFIRYGTFGVRAYPFEAPKSDYYYIRLRNSVVSHYLLLVGEPTYALATCRIKLNTVTMANGKSVDREFDLNADNRIPDGAIIQNIWVSGVRTTAAQSITVKNVTENKTMKMNQYTWDLEKLASSNISVKSKWKVTFDYFTNYTFTPTVEFVCIYPLTSVHADMELEITR